MKLLDRVVERIATMVLLVAGAGLLIVMFLGAGDVIGTQFFGWPVPGAKEASESTMVLIVFGSLAYAQIQRQHIRVELLYTRQSPRVKAALDTVTNLLAMVFFAIVLWQTFGEAVESWKIREADVGLIRFPLYPAKSFVVLGTAVMLVQLGLDLLHSVQRLRGREAIEPPEEAPPEAQVKTM
jgi:TRAP-type mannitol/chloroaromatic compound transport system permease small subunit